MVENFNSFNENNTSKAETINMWNTYMEIVVGLDNISAETGEVLPSHINPKVIEEMNALSTPISGVSLGYININEDRIKKNAKDLLDGIRTAISKGDITEEKYFKTGILNKMKTILSRDILGLKN